MRYRFVLASLIAALVAPALADTPWLERAIDHHVDQKSLAGRLDGAALQSLVARGETLFTAKFTKLDGVGRPMATQAIIPTRRKRMGSQLFQRLAGSDSLSCVSCHNDPAAGGAGDLITNAFVSEGFTNADFDTTDPQFSNERNTNHLMGAGLIELLAREMSVELHAQRTSALDASRASGEVQTIHLNSKGVDFGTIEAHPNGMVDFNGLDGIDTDLVVRPFGQKGVFTSLRQFTINALNHHHGMQADERFGARWTGTDDFDEDGVGTEVTAGDISALVAWQATRRAPGRLEPRSDEWELLAKRGDAVFETLKCQQCHRRSLPLDSLVFTDPGPFDTAGTLRPGELRQPASYDLSLLPWIADLPRDQSGAVLVPLFGDLKRHRIADSRIDLLGNELLPQRFVDRDVFQTAELWGVASTAPYGHRGDQTTLDEIILAHGGEARSSRDAYAGLPAQDRVALIAFLKTLVITP